MYDLVKMSEGLQNLFTPDTIFFLILGFILGFIVGAIPGFNDANLMSILLPFTLYISPKNAIISMSALYFAAQAAGAIPAILINIPGTPGTAATVFEGYPMSQKGKSGFALGISITASTIGSVFGATWAIILTPILGTVALMFGPAEMFMVAVFGLTVVSALTGDNMAKGLLAAVLGILISLIGADSMTAFSRGTFGILELEDGFPLVPPLLGLFGFSELLFLMRKSSVAKEGATDSMSQEDIMEGMRECIRHKLVLLRACVAGTIIGIIPGAGATIGSFVAYGQAKQWSKSPEKYGTGFPEGLVASDSGNNAVAPAALIPLLTLGIPGSGSTTIMLVTLMLHGVDPGPRFFLNFQADVWTILFSMLISSLLIAAVGLPVARYFKKVAFIPTQILVPIVAVLLFTGGFAWRFLPFDILLMVVFGLLGVIMKIYNYPIPALLLALILGPILEGNYLRAVRIGGFPILFESPIVLMFWALTVLSLFAPILTRRMSRINGA